MCFNYIYLPPSYSSIFPRMWKYCLNRYETLKRYNQHCNFFIIFTLLCVRIMYNNNNNNQKTRALQIQHKPETKQNTSEMLFFGTSTDRKKYVLINNQIYMYRICIERESSPFISSFLSWKLN